MVYKSEVTGNLSHQQILILSSSHFIFVGDVFIVLLVLDTQLYLSILCIYWLDEIKACGNLSSHNKFKLQNLLILFPSETMMHILSFYQWNIFPFCTCISWLDNIKVCVNLLFHNCHISKISLFHFSWILRWVSNLITNEDFFFSSFFLPLQLLHFVTWRNKSLP